MTFISKGQIALTRRTNGLPRSNRRPESAKDTTEMTLTTRPHQSLSGTKQPEDPSEFICLKRISLGCVPGPVIWVWPLCGNFIVAIYIPRSELLVGLSVRLSRTTRATYPLVAVEVLERLRILHTCTQYKTVPLCQSQQGSDCDLQIILCPTITVGLGRHGR